MVTMMTISLMFLPSIRPEVRDFAESIHGALKLLFDFTPRFVFGSLLAYLLSQSFDVWAFHYLKHKTKGKHLWLRNNLSTMISQIIDTIIYSLVVWWAIVDLKIAIQLALAKYVFKVIIALIDTPFIYWARGWDVSDKDWFDERDNEFAEKQENLKLAESKTS